MEVSVVNITPAKVQPDHARDKRDRSFTSNQYYYYLLPQPDMY